tara:strand:- start:124 stop:294 length:171 start_codon:yes stop_codon:yes gene_type:complete
MIFDRVLRAAVMRLNPFAIQAEFDLRRDFFYQPPNNITAKTNLQSDPPVTARYFHS